MKKFLWIAIVLIVIVACAIPIHQEKDVIIKARYENVNEQLLKPENWKYWDPDVKTAWHEQPGSVTFARNNLNFTIHGPNLLVESHSNGFGFSVRKKADRQVTNYSFIVLLDRNMHYTAVHMITDTYGIKWLTNILTNRNPFAALKGLKQYLEDVKAYYGFDIRTINIVDTNIVVMHETVALDKKMFAIESIQRNLNQVISSYHLQPVQPITADIRVIHPDSVRVMIGVPVSQGKLETKNVQMMHMSHQSRELSINYSGIYRNRQAAYNALSKYISDHDISTNELAYEKYLDNRIPLSDTVVVHMQILWPIQ